jgi:hypothetical protein
MVSACNDWRFHLENAIISHDPKIIAYLILLDAYKPAERHNAYIWGYVADACTIIQITLSIVYICQPLHDDPDAERWFRCAY